MGGEFRAKGVNVALGPVVGPLGRMVESGRDWEGLSKHSSESIVTDLIFRIF